MTKLSERLGKRQWRYEHTSIDRDEWDELVALEQRVEWLDKNHKELAAMLDFYITDESDEGWGLQTKTTRDAFRAMAWPEATAAFGMWEEDEALASQEEEA